MNQLFFDITTLLQQYSQYGVPLFITSAQNLGVPFPYPIYARVYHLGQVYINQVAGNITTPPDPSWSVSSDSAGVGLASFQVFTTGSGTYTPTAGTQSILVEVVGGGGGGGNSSSNVNGGGGGGGYAKLWIPAVGTSYAYAVAAAVGSATAGNTTTFGASLQATGGGAGTAPGSTLGSAAGGAGGIGSGGDLNIAGGPGGNSSYSGSLGQSASSGVGGNSFYGGGGVGVSNIASTAAGVGGRGYGAGGSGSTSNGGGGAGTGGLIYIAEYA